jgi:hypothetical protein
VADDDADGIYTELSGRKGEEYRALTHRIISYSAVIVLFGSATGKG